MTTNNETSEENTTVTTESIVTNITDATSQSIFNQKSITIVESSNELEKLDKWDLRSVYVNNDGKYDYSVSKSLWVKDETYSTYDFKSAQPIQYYFDQLENWDDAIFQAQLNIYLKGYSTRLIFPTGTINISKPILGGCALALKIHEYLVSNKVETDFYDSVANTFKKYVWGQEFIGTRSCTINWTGSTIGTDVKWRDWAIFHIGCPPTHMDWMRNESISPVCDDHVKFENIHIFGNGAFIHGIFVQRQSFVKISFCQVLSCLGSGVFIDRTYDSAFEKLTVLHCGRMVGSTESEAYEKGYGIDKQLMHRYILLSRVVITVTT